MHPYIDEFVKWKLNNFLFIQTSYLNCLDQKVLIHPTYTTLAQLPKRWVHLHDNVALHVWGAHALVIWANST